MFYLIDFLDVSLEEVERRDNSIGKSEGMVHVGCLQTVSCSLIQIAGTGSSKPA